jgi:hypothetical protein
VGLRGLGCSSSAKSSCGPGAQVCEGAVVLAALVDGEGDVIGPTEEAHLQHRAHAEYRWRVGEGSMSTWLDGRVVWSLSLSLHE